MAVASEAWTRVVRARDARAAGALVVEDMRGALDVEGAGDVEEKGVLDVAEEAVMRSVEWALATGCPRPAHVPPPVTVCTSPPDLSLIRQLELEPARSQSNCVELLW